MESSIADRLKRRGLDTDFLCWLEGEPDRLPRWDAVRDLKAEQLLAAVRAVVWLTQFYGQSDVIAPTSGEAWHFRYVLLQDYLWGVLKSTLHFSMLKQHDDLEALEQVLLKLLPLSSSDVYRADFVHLRRHGYPITLPSSVGNMRGPRSGGKRESEQTGRMRAAVAYVRRVSDTPYDDLAEFWNECSGSSTVYQPDTIRGRLRKGHFMNRQPGAAEEFLEHWKDVYAGDLIRVSPVPFPLSRELREAYERKGGDSNTTT